MNSLSIGYDRDRIVAYLYREVEGDGDMPWKEVYARTLRFPGFFIIRFADGGWSFASSEEGVKNIISDHYHRRRLS